MAATAVIGVVVPALLERCGILRSGAPVAGAFMGLCLGLALLEFNSAFRTVFHGPNHRLLSARTLTGVHTLDMAALSRIRRIRTPSRPGWVDELWITDHHGVSLLVRDKKVIRRLASYAARTTANPDNPTTAPLRISRHAAARLGLVAPSRPRRAARATIDFLIGLYTPMATAALAALTTWLLTTARA
jgi:hypothetical protein